MRGLDHKEWKCQDLYHHVDLSTQSSLDWLTTFFGADFCGDGEAPLIFTRPYMYGGNVVTKLFVVSIVNLKD